ncbi:hypothetical protein F1640_18420 [Novosphingobium sp. NBM11]|uniref:hypothetical protein n=1 Tax=Novosphingobium sp. NBM11 TaxID=2596914 RepID=UPI00189266AF|nr:hypothetical protein [Novosphingobium sp. NBM11]MBF5091931.1 hypothetical protein [Novosphingobium sp. NBM11]
MMAAPALINAAERRALAQYIADLPSPEEMAAILPADAIDALARAVRRPEGFMCRDAADAKALRFYGLCDYPSKISNGAMLTVLGMQVRRIVMDLRG